MAKGCITGFFVNSSTQSSFFHIRPDDRASSSLCFWLAATVFNCFFIALNSS